MWVSGDLKYMTVAEARAATGEPSVVELDEPWPGIGRGIWASLRGGEVPARQLGRWRWTRHRLRKRLVRHLRHRTLPCPPDSPLARERLWFLAQLISTRRSSPRHEPLPTQPLKDRVAEMLARTEGAQRSTWHIGSHEIDQDDVRWLHGMLGTVAGEEIRRPAPEPDLRGWAPSASRMYSPQQALALATAVLQAAVIGYRDLVLTNFPSFGPALGHFSAYPVEVDGVIDFSGDAPLGLETGITYRVRHVADVQVDEMPRVKLALADDDTQNHLRFELWHPSTGRPSRRPSFSHSGIHDSVPDMYHARPATNLAYSWLSSDLHALGWLERNEPFWG